jgi:hypothetical protein
MSTDTEAASQPDVQNDHRLDPRVKRALRSLDRGRAGCVLTCLLRISKRWSNRSNSMAARSWPGPTNSRDAGGPSWPIPRGNEFCAVMLVA